MDFPYLYYALLAALLFPAIIVFLRRLARRRDASSQLQLPTVGIDFTQAFPWTRARLRSVLQSSANMYEGYSRFCKTHDMPFVTPSFGNGPVVVLPPSYFDVLNRSENDLMAFPAQMETLQAKYTMGDRNLKLFKNPIQFDVVRKHMRSGVGFFAPETDDELRQVFEQSLKFDGEWKRVNVWQVCLQVVGRIANRAFVGLPLCRNEELLEQSTAYARVVYQGAILITALPTALMPVFGPLVGLVAKRHASKCTSILEPYVEERLRIQSSKGACEGTGTVPNDALQWMIQQSVKGSSVAEVNAREIAQRLLILHSNSKNEYIDGLRSECSRVAADHDGLTSQTAIDRLYRTDSTVRESMRISPFDVVALFRHVSSVKSLDTGRGIVLPPNTRIGVPFQAIQHDERYFEHPLRFDAFRFSRMFEGPDGGGRRPDRDRELVVDISESFLAFGYGRHACPGRWYVSQTLKQSLVFFVQHYDVEMVAPTEKPKTLFNTVLPPLATEIRIRLRDAEC